MNGEDGAMVMVWPDSVLISCQPPSWTIRQSRTRLSRSVPPPSIQWTTWWPSHQDAGRSQPGQRQWPSRAISALRAGPEITLLERPTSMVTDLAEQDPGHAAVAGHPLHGGGGDGERKLHLRPRRPGQPLPGLDRRRDLDVGRLAARSQLDQRVGVALVQDPVVVLA